MPKISFKEILNNISLYKLSGIREFILINIGQNSASLSLVKVASSLFNITKKNKLEKLEVVYQTKIDLSDGLRALTKTLKETKSKFSLDESYLIIGIDDFRFKTLKISKDSEEKEYWFEENTDQFLPQGKSSDEFIYSYKNYFEDDDNEYYYVAIARKNNIDEIIKSCSIDSFSIINISPFTLQLPTCSEDNLLLLYLNENVIQYTFFDNDKNLINSIVYISSNGKDEDNNQRVSAIKNALTEINQNLSTHLSNKNNDLNLYAIAENGDQEKFEKLVATIISSNISNSKTAKESNIVLQTLVLNNLFNGSDNLINLLPKEEFDKSAELVEKKTSLRVILSLGVVLILLLLLTYAGENYITGNLNNKENQLVEVNAKSKMLENYKTENLNLQNNLSGLNKLRGNRVVYSEILSELSEAINNKCCFTKLSAEKVGKKIDITIEGLSYSQDDVTEMIKRIENLEDFSKISLNYSNKVKKNSYNSNKIPISKNLINFSFNANYNEVKQ